MIDKNFLQILSNKATHIYEKDGVITSVLVIIPHFEYVDFMTKDFLNYISSLDDGKVATLTRNYIVIDILDYVTKWLEDDIEDYIKNETRSKNS